MEHTIQMLSKMQHQKNRQKNVCLIIRYPKRNRQHQTYPTPIVKNRTKTFVNDEIIRRKLAKFDSAEKIAISIISENSGKFRYSHELIDSSNAEQTLRYNDS